MINRDSLRKRLKAAAIAAMLLMLAACCVAQVPSNETAPGNSSPPIELGAYVAEAGDIAQPAIKAPELVSPSGILNTGAPTYVWKSVAASQYYCLEVRDDRDAVVLRLWYNATDLPVGPTCSVTPLQVLKGGDYTWWVQSWKCGDNKWSREMQFSVCSSGAYPARAALVSPKDITGSKSPTFVWKAVDGCTQYCLKVANANDQNHPLIEECYDAEEVISDDLCSINPGLDLTSGTYRWWIKTRNCKGDGPWSNYYSFKYQNKPPAKCTPLSPNGLVSTATPLFIWTAAPGTVQYHLQLDNSTTRILNEWYDAAAVTKGSRCSAFLPIALPDDDALYSWRIRGENDAGNGSWSSFKGFETVCAFKKKNATIVAENNSLKEEKN